MMVPVRDPGDPVSLPSEQRRWRDPTDSVLIVGVGGVTVLVLAFWLGSVLPRLLATTMWVVLTIGFSVLFFRSRKKLRRMRRDFQDGSTGDTD